MARTQKRNAKVEKAPNSKEIKRRLEEFHRDLKDSAMSERGVMAHYSYLSRKNPQDQSHERMADAAWMRVQAIDRALEDFQRAGLAALCQTT